MQGYLMHDISRGLSQWANQYGRGLERLFRQAGFFNFIQFLLEGLIK